MEEKIYTCECGKTFTKPNSFNGHKSHCQIHLGKDRYKEITISREIGCKKAGQKTIDRYISTKIIQNNSWISEKHTCERCGKIMTGKFGSGRFCSRACANSHKQSTEQNESRRNKLKNSHSEKTKAYFERRKKSSLQKEILYYQTPKVCSICGKVLNFNQKNRKTCSPDCRSIFCQQNAKKNNLGGLQNITSWGKRGEYKGIHCDSRFELAFLVYCLDKGIKIERNNASFIYTWKNKTHKYYPDFLLVDEHKYVELRGYDADKALTSQKLNSVIEAGYNIEILYENDLKIYFKYIKDTYGLSYNKMQELYDK